MVYHLDLNYAPAPQVALPRLANVATQAALRRVRAFELGCDDPFHRHSATCVFVKAGAGKLHAQLERRTEASARAVERASSDPTGLKVL
jgi:hypothetical protein